MDIKNKADLRLPTDTYAYIEMHVEDTPENIIQAYRDLVKLWQAGGGLVEAEWQIVLDEYLWGKQSMDSEEYANMNFLEKDYKMPVNSNYYKFKEGKNKFRVLSDAITGWEYWTTENKPVRSEEPFEEMPEDIKKDKEGKSRINHFWAFIVYSYENKRVQILELTQKSIMNAIKSYLDEPDWGDVKE